MFGQKPFLFRWLAALFMGAALLWGTGPSLAEGDGQIIMNWRLSLPKASPSQQSAPAYRPRRRTDAVSRYQDDSALGLHMPPIRVEVPILADASAPKIAVIGDSLAEALAAGFDGDPNIRTAYRLVERTRSASGLVRDDYYSWPANLATMLQDNRDLAAIVIMVGLNDRQVLKIGETTHEPLSDPWREEYRKRIDSLLVLARDQRIPVVWVGMPLMRSPKLSADLVSLNGLVRERVSNFGQTFVETVDAFADVAGAFSATGPDVIGDNVRLRGPDGIHFTPAGQRKLAFFVDRALRRIVGDKTEPVVASLPASPGVAIPAPAVPIAVPAVARPVVPGSIANPIAIPLHAPVFAPQRPAIGERRVLGEIRQAGSLLGGHVPRYGETVNRDLFDRGLTPEARPGRSDDHGWR